MTFEARTLVEVEYRLDALTAGAGPVELVFFPALGDRAETIRACFGHLQTHSKQGLRLWAVDPPGYGANPGPLLGIDDHLRACSALTQVLEGPVVVIGNSAGGIAAVRLASACAARGLVLLAWSDPSIGLPATSILTPQGPKDMQKLLQRSWARPPNLGAKGLSVLLEGFRRPDYRRHAQSLRNAPALADELSSFDGRLAFVGGANDGLIPPSLLEKCHQAHADSELHIIENSGHYPHRERPKALSQWLGQFIHRCTNVPS